jgi:hypothetical protein
MKNFSHKAEITELIQRMLIPLPTLRTQAHQVNELPLFQVQYDDEDPIHALARACGVALEFVFDDSINMLCV